jgi:hypothetical protein
VPPIITDTSDRKSVDNNDTEPNDELVELCDEIRYRCFAESGLTLDGAEWHWSQRRVIWRAHLNGNCNWARLPRSIVQLILRSAFLLPPGIACLARMCRELRIVSCDTDHDESGCSETVVGHFGRPNDMQFRVVSGEGDMYPAPVAWSNHEVDLMMPQQQQAQQWMRIAFWGDVGGRVVRYEASVHELSVLRLMDARALNLDAPAQRAAMKQVLGFFVACEGGAHARRLGRHAITSGPWISMPKAERVVVE